MGYEHYAEVTIDELARLAGQGNAALLLLHLRANHAVRKAPFAIAADAMAGGAVGMSPKTIRAARNVLIERGFLECVYTGGRGPRDPSKYRLTTPAQQAGAE